LPIRQVYPGLEKPIGYTEEKHNCLHDTNLVISAPNPLSSETTLRIIHKSKFLVLLHNNSVCVDVSQDCTSLSKIIDSFIKEKCEELLDFDIKGSQLKEQSNTNISNEIEVGIGERSNSLSKFKINKNLNCWHTRSCECQEKQEENKERSINRIVRHQSSQRKQRISNARMAQNLSTFKLTWQRPATTVESLKCKEPKEMRSKNVMTATSTKITESAAQSEAYR
jgi:hypothetical protein